MASWGSLRDEEFAEEEIWSFAKERDDDSSGSKMKVSSSIDSSGSSAWHLAKAPRKIPRAITQSSHEKSDHVVLHGSSAPLNIPDWSKIYQKNVKEESKTYEDHFQDNDAGGSDDDDDMIPPHEWIARKLARSQISSFSVCEGVGRTLKGRDLSKVRNAILTKTGFIE